MGSQKGKPKPRRLGKYYKKLLKETGTPAETLAAHVYDPSIPISSLQEQQLKRIRAAWSMLIDFKSSTEVVAMLMDYFNITERQCYNDIKLAKKTYGDISKGDKEGERQIAIAMAQKAFKVALANDDASAMNGAISRIILLQGLDQTDPNLPSPEELKGNSYVLQIQSSGDIKTIPLDEIPELKKEEKEQVMSAINNMVIPVDDIEEIMDNE